MRKRKLISILVIAMMLVVSLPATVFAATPQTWGVGAFGDNITGELLSDGTLILSGTGPMNGYPGVLVAPYNTQVTKVIIKEGITSIGDAVFRDCLNIVSVSIPSTVTQIGESAFAECRSLTSVTIPSSVSVIRSQAFAYCTKLATIVNNAVSQYVYTDAYDSAGGEVAGPLYAYGFNSNNSFKDAVEYMLYTWNQLDGNQSITTNGAIVEVVGEVVPIDIAATATLSTYLAIDPNITGAAAFVSPVVMITNDCQAPLEAFAVSCKATNTAPKVTSENAVTNWDILSKAQTASMIALGLSGGDITDTIWFADEASQTPQKIASLPVDGSDNFTFHGKFGRAIDTAQAYKYQMVLKLSLKD